MNKNLLVVLTGKTASGKDTIKTTLLNKYPNFKKVLTTTSRVPRPNEKDGIDYHFLTRLKFEQKVGHGDFAEWVEYGGNLYGTEKVELEKALNSDTIWKIDPSRAGEVRDFIKRVFPTQIADQFIKRIVVLYITCDNQTVLQRLKNRGLTEEEIQKRMSDDKEIWQQYKDNYDFVIDNIPDQLDQTIDKVTRILENHHS